MLEICKQEKYKLSNQICLKNLFFHLVHIHHFFIPEIKYVIWGTVRWGNVFGELSLGEMSSGEMSVGELSEYHVYTVFRITPEQ